MKVDFHKRYQPVNQLKFVEDALFSENLASDGTYGVLLKDLFKSHYEIENILFVPSASGALELGAFLLDLFPGDEVIVPSYNFPSAANAVLKWGGVPIFCDVEPDTKNLCLEDVAAKITKRTKAVIPTHYAGISCDMDLLLGLAKSHHIRVMEDAAQGVDSRYKGKPLGTIGAFGAYSFHHTKNFSCGEGGGFICNDPALMEQAEIIRDNGTDKARFLKKQASSYSWRRPGSNYMMSEACSALLYGQMLEAEEITRKRGEIAGLYRNFLEQEVTFVEKVTCMKIPDYVKPNHHIFYVNCMNGKVRETLREGMLLDGIDVRSHFVPLHISEFGKSLGYEPSDLPESVRAAETLLRLPIHTEMTGEDAEVVMDALLKIVKIL